MLRLDGLTKDFGRTRAVDHVSLEVPDGQFLGVIGRSGAGKSTLLRMINRLETPAGGSIRYHDTEVTGLTGAALRSWRCQSAMIFQQFNLIPRLDVLTNVLMGRLNHRGTLPSLFGLFTAAERAMALAALERFDMLETALVRAGNISGGQQQRVAICRALLQQPKLLLADEPIASLDPHNATIVMDALRRVNRDDGLTVICNLHHIDIARAYCDRIVAMNAGRVVFDGPAGALTPAVIETIYGIPESQFHAAA